MKNIFSQTKDYVKQPKRNVFDMSFQNNGTFNFGTLYPVFCKEVIPGDSVSIDTTFALRFLPLAFPIQTRVQANLHFFYVRNRNLWDDWKKFITHTDDSVVFPFLQGRQSCLQTCGLADYLGVPTSLIGKFSGSYGNDYPSYDNEFNASGFFNSVKFNGKDTYQPYGYVSSAVTFGSSFTNNSSAQQAVTTMRLNDYFYNQLPKQIVIAKTASNSVSYPNQLLLVYFDGNKASSKEIGTAYYTQEEGGSNVYIPRDFTTYEKINQTLSEKYKNSVIGFGIVDTRNGINNSIFPSSYEYTPGDGSDPFMISLLFDSYDRTIDLSSLSLSQNPFVHSNSKNIRISALPFRAYESIYNAFYRNELNDPLFIDGSPSYDVYCPNTEGGADTFEYTLHNRNWELDFLTSAVQSPQQGIAPLVGVSSSGNFTFVNKDSDGNIGYFTADAQFSSDGSTITGFKLSDKVTLSGVPSTDVGNVPDDVKRGTIYSLNQMALAGISINDFRNVNSLQRWLEANIRRGYKYRDQIKSHFGVDVSYKELDMPEFIGGMSEPVYINQVNQTTETETDPLGSYAGQASLLASSNHTIRHYCDEHGFIMGILSIVPVPNYSQLLPKHFLKYNYLDYYFPEFGHIGMQPIDYREVCPIQAYVSDASSINNTFGYQRAWYDYLASVDEVHGLFRLNLRNFVLNRQFDSLPRLNKDFLQIDAEQLNDVFTVQDISDKILGQIKFNCIFKRPIPKFGIPRLE